MRQFLFTSIFVLASIGHAALTNSDQQSLPFQNLISNSGFENNKASWTASANTFTIDSTNFAAGKASGLMSMSSQTGTLTNTVTPTIQTNGVNMEASCSIKTTLTTAQVCAMANGVELSCTNAPSSGNWSNVPINFVGPTNGQSVGVRVKSSASATGTITVDDCYVGKARNVGTVAQSQWMGAIKYAQASSCTWFQTSSSSYVSASAVAACSNGVVTGQASSPGSKIPAITFATLAPGTYTFVANGRAGSASTNSTFCGFQFNDGTNSFGYSSFGFGGTTDINTSLSLSGQVTYTTAQTNLTVNLQAILIGGSTSGTCRINNNQVGDSFSIDVYYTPSSTQQVVSVNQGPFFTDWATYTPTIVGLGTTTTNQFQWRRVGDSMEIQGKYTTGTPTGSTISYTLPNSLSTADTTKIPSTMIIGVLGRGLNSTSAYTWSVIASASSTTLNVGFMSDSFSVARNPISAEVGTAFNASETHSFFARVPITGWTSPSAPVPILVGSVSSNSSGAERIERVAITGGTTPTIASQSGNWVSGITRNSVGNYTLNLVSGMFSQAPTCTQICKDGALSGISEYVSDPTTTTVNSTCVNTNNDTGVDNDRKVICVGPR